jgi:hypothetical protein
MLGRKVTEDKHGWLVGSDEDGANEQFKVV